MASEPHANPLHAPVEVSCVTPYREPSVAVPEREIQTSHPLLLASSGQLQAFLSANAAQARVQPVILPVTKLTVGAQEPDGQPTTWEALKLIPPIFEDHA